MDFNSIWLLVLLLGIPILVHLFSFRKVKKIYFSNIKFINSSVSSAKSRTKLKHLLILGTRLCCFALLLLLFYNFFFETYDDSEYRVQGLFLDDSPSMYIEKDADRSIDEANALIGQLGVDERNISSETHLLINSSVVISDFQGIDEAMLDILVADSSKLRTFYVTGDLASYSNAFIDSLHIDFNPDDFSKRKVELFPRLSGKERNGNLVFRLLHAGRQLSSIVRDANDADKITFDVPIDAHGDFLVQIEGDDALYDNEFRFVISDSKKPTVLLVDTHKNQYLQSVFANSNLFTLLKTDLNNLDYDLLQQSDLVVLNEVEQLPSGLIAQLKDKSVIIIAPTTNENPLEMKWMGIGVEPAENDFRYEIEVNLDHPILKGVYDEKKQGGTMPSAKASFEVSGDFETIAKLRNGNPLLLKSQEDDHYFLNVPMRSEYTDLPTHSIFLPLLYKITLSSVDFEAKNSYYPGDLGFLESAKRTSAPTIASKDVEVIPEFNLVQNGIAFLIPNLEPGFYELMHDEDTIGLAINLPKKESLMNGLSKQELSERYGDLSHVSVHSSGNTHLLQGIEDNNLWKYALILIVFVLLTETLFHKYL